MHLEISFFEEPVGLDSRKHWPDANAGHLQTFVGSVETRQPRAVKILAGEKNSMFEALIIVDRIVWRVQFPEMQQ